MSTNRQSSYVIRSKLFFTMAHKGGLTLGLQQHATEDCLGVSWRSPDSCSSCSSCISLMCDHKKIYGGYLKKVLEIFKVCLRKSHGLHEIYEIQGKVTMAAW